MARQYITAAKLLCSTLKPRLPFQQVYTTFGQRAGELSAAAACWMRLRVNFFHSEGREEGVHFIIKE